MRGAMSLEALPVVRKLPGQEHVPEELARARVYRIRAEAIELDPLRRARLSCEGLVEIAEEIRRQHDEFVAVSAAIAFRGRPAVPLAKLDQEMERGHLHGFLDALRQLRDRKSTR